MLRDVRLLGFEAWMDAALNDDGWGRALQTSLRLLEARAIAVLSRSAHGEALVSADAGAPTAFIEFVRAMTPTRSAGLERCEIQGLGNLAWIRVEGRADHCVADLTLVALARESIDAALLAELAMIAARAAAANTRLTSSRAAAALMTAAFDHLPFGVMIADRNGAVAEINEACRVLLARGDGLSLLRGKLMCREPADQRAVLGAIAGALAGHPANVVKVVRSGGAEPYVVRVVCPQREPAIEPGHCLLMIVDPDEAPAPGPEIWRAMFDLTDCELIIAEGLVSGRRITEIANERGVSIETVRTQTKRMFERLNVSSQAEATARLCRATPFRESGLPRRRLAAANG